MARVKAAEFMPCAAPDRRPTTFHRVELFQAVELVAIEFFDFTRAGAGEATRNHFRCERQR
jgi:hypothetical protein